MTDAETYRFADFTEAHYTDVVREAASRLSFEPFGSTIEKPHVLWRHDVDFSVHRALALARIEAAEGVRSTFFLRTRSAFYNPLEPAVNSRIRELAALGHWIGLHFDMAAYPNQIGAGDLEGALAREARLVADAAGAEVGAVSFHNPGHSGGESIDDERLAGMVNAYAGSIRERYEYVSDSNGYWRDRRLADVVGDGRIKRLHVLTHPEWWQREPMSPRERMERSANGLAQAAIESYAGPVREAGRRIIG